MVVAAKNVPPRPDAAVPGFHEPPTESKQAKKNPLNPEQAGRGAEST